MGGGSVVWEVPPRATRALFAASIGHVLPAIARTATTLGLTVYPTPHVIDVVDSRGRGLDRLLHRLARELTTRRDRSWCGWSPTRRWTAAS